LSSSAFANTFVGSSLYRLKLKQSIIIIF